jgi:hypothetical protein
VVLLQNVASHRYTSCNACVDHPIIHPLLPQPQCCDSDYYYYYYYYADADDHDDEDEDDAWCRSSCLSVVLMMMYS